jgi:hypothetical protein
MSFTFRAYFSGVCAIVPNDEIKKATKLCFLMPSSGRHDQDWDPIAAPALDGRPLSRHVAFIKFNLANLLGSTAPQGAEGLWYLHRQRISFRFEVDESQGLDQESPDLEIIYDEQQKISGQIDTQSLHWVPELERILGKKLCQVDPTLILKEQPSNKITAQILIERGTVGVEDLAETLWRFQPKITPKSYEQYLAHKTFTEVAKVKKMWIRSQPLDSASAAKEYEFWAEDGQTLEMSFFTACEKNPLDWKGSAVGRLKTDPDFRWHYQLLTADCQAAVKKELKKGMSGLRSLPIPWRIDDAQSAHKLGQDNNCIDTRLPPMSFAF